MKKTRKTKVRDGSLSHKSKRDDDDDAVPSPTKVAKYLVDTFSPSKWLDEGDEKSSKGSKSGSISDFLTALVNLTSTTKSEPPLPPPDWEQEGKKSSGYTTLHCRAPKCGRVITRYKGKIGLKERMSRIRHHYMKYHPTLFRKMIKKALKTRRENQRKKDK